MRFPLKKQFQLWKIWCSQFRKLLSNKPWHLIINHQAEFKKKNSTWCQIWCLWQHRDRNSYCLILQSKQLRHHRPKYLGSHWQWTGIRTHKVCWLSMRGFLYAIHSEVKHVWNWIMYAYVFISAIYQIDAFTKVLHSLFR